MGAFCQAEPLTEGARDGASWSTDDRDQLSADERKTLQGWVRRHSSAQALALALRSRIVLACAEGRTNTDIAAELHVNRVTVSKWRHRFAPDRLDKLMDAPRPGAQRTIGDDVIQAVIVDTLESTPGEDTHWSTRGLAAKHAISHTTVAENLESVRTETMEPGLVHAIP
jgi:transposase